MNGPISKPNMSSLFFKDIVILKQFLEKGRRNNLFIEEEMKDINIIHVKLSNILKEIIEKKQQLSTK